MNHDKHGILDAILNAYDGKNIDLPAPPPALEINNDNTELLMVALESQLGEAANSDYFKCSRERFSHIVKLAMRHVPAGGRLPDIGNAPGFLGLALLKAGFSVDGINLSDAWNSTYPDQECLNRFSVKSCNIEQDHLPYSDGSFDGVVFTEVLEHIAIKAPEQILPEFKRVLKPNGVVLFSTPNVCNLSNIVALAKGLNVFWRPEIFYGSLDRHNREYTPGEVRELFDKCGFQVLDFYGINDHANWRAGAAADIYSFLGRGPNDHPLLRNTIIGVFSPTQ